VRVGIIGAGVAGLTAAWLLQDEHEVTLLEKQPRLGGHAHTVEVQHAGETIPAESGFEFFAEEGYPTFSKLLHLLHVRLRRYPMTFTLYSAKSGRAHLLPPSRTGFFFWPTLAPRSLAYLVQFAFLLRRAEELVTRRDTAVTIQEFIERFPFSPAFRAAFLYPFLGGGWGFPLPEFRRMAAYNVLKYLVVLRPVGLTPRAFSEVAGGIATYVAALRAAMPRVTIRAGADIRHVRRCSGGFTAVDAAGNAYNFEHLVFATNAVEAGRLLRGVDGAEAERAVLHRFRYLRSTIAVHGDRRFMPREQRHWSVFNIRWSPERSLGTVWQQHRASIPLFRSWMAPDDPTPEPLYHMTHYDHPAMDVEHFAAQRKLAVLQGRHNLRFAGLYAHDIDSHESAVRSAVFIARQLAPGSPHLASLL
jgi:predicted NAD/FAD-binding protein